MIMSDFNRRLIETATFGYQAFDFWPKMLSFFTLVEPGQSIIIPI